MLKTLVAAYLLFVNGAAAGLCWADKRRASTGTGSRVRERSLLGAALLGGSPGLLLALLLSRHKVRKAPFLARFLAVAAFQLLAAIAWVRG